MRKLMLVAAAMAAFVVPSVSNAQVSLGLRLGFAPAMGDADKNVKMSDGPKSQIPVQIDALYAVIPNLKVGAYFSYGIGQSGCQDGADCSFNVMRFGVQGQYDFAAVSGFKPWAGVGTGYEILSSDLGDGSFNTTGFEFLNVQGGADYKVAEKLAVGPYLQLSVGQYSKSDGESIAEKGMHQWFGFGVRGTFDL